MQFAICHLLHLPDTGCYRLSAVGCYLGNIDGMICMDNWILSIIRLSFDLVWTESTRRGDAMVKLHSERVSSYNNFTWDWDLACADALHRILFLHLNSEKHRLYIHEKIQKHFGTILLTLPQTIVCISLLSLSLIECWKTAMLFIYVQGIWWSFWKMTVI